MFSLCSLPTLSLSFLAPFGGFGLALFGLASLSLLSPLGARRGWNGTTFDLLSKRAARTADLLTSDILSLSPPLMLILPITPLVPLPQLSLSSITNSDISPLLYHFPPLLPPHRHRLLSLSQFWCGTRSSSFHFSFFPSVLCCDIIILEDRISYETRQLS